MGQGGFALEAMYIVDAGGDVVHYLADCGSGCVSK